MFRNIRRMVRLSIILMAGETSRYAEKVLLRNKTLYATKNTACIIREINVGIPISVFSSRFLNIAIATAPARIYINNSPHPPFFSSITEIETSPTPEIIPISVFEKSASITKSDMYGHNTLGIRLNTHAKISVTKYPTTKRFLTTLLSYNNLLCPSETASTSIKTTVPAIATETIVFLKIAS